MGEIKVSTGSVKGIYGDIKFVPGLSAPTSDCIFFISNVLTSCLPLFSIKDLRDNLTDYLGQEIQSVVTEFIDTKEFVIIEENEEDNGISGPETIDDL